MNMKFPDVFENQSLIATAEPAALCADGLTAWALCHMGQKPPESFGETLVKIRKRIGMSGAATGENLMAHADKMGWGKTEPQPAPTT